MGTPEIHDPTNAATPRARPPRPARARARGLARKLVTVAAVAATGLAGSLVAVSSPAAAAPATATALAAGSIAWSPCLDDDPIMGAYLRGLECGSLAVPLDHARPGGR